MAVRALLLVVLVVLVGEGVEGRYNVIYACDKCMQFEELSDWVLTFVNAIKAKIEPIGGTFKLVNANYSVDPDAQVVAHIKEEVLKPPGFHHVLTSAAGTFVGISLAAELPDVKVTVNQAWFVPPIPNFQGLAFREDQLGFLAGMVAGLQTKTGRVACLGGPKFPGVQAGRNSFNMGVRSVCPTCGVDGIFGNHFENTTEGEMLARLFVQRGADVIFSYGGKTSLAGIKAVAGEAFVIGSGETDVWEDAFERDNGTRGQHVLATVLKDTELAVGFSLQDGIDGTFQSGWKMMDIRNGGVRLTGCHAACGSFTPLALNSIEQVTSEFKRGVRDTGVDFQTGVVQLGLPPLATTSLTGHFGDGAAVGDTPRVALFGDKMLLVGGQYEETVWYNRGSFSVDRFTSRGTLPSPRSGVAAVGTGVHGYVVGGEGPGGEPQKDIYRLEFPCNGVPGFCGGDPLWKRVSDGGAMPPRHSHSAVVNGSSVFVYGGLGTRAQVSDDLWRFDIANGTLELLSETSSEGARYDHSATTYHSAKPVSFGGVVDTDFMLVFGGRSAGGTLGQLMAYGLNSKQWGTEEPLGEAPAARWGACMVAVNGRVLLTRGVGVKGELHDTWVYSPAHRVWTELTDSAQQVIGGPVACALDKAQETVVSEEGLPEFVKTYHRVMLVGATQDTHKSGFGVYTYPSIKCNETLHFVLSQDGTQCQQCPNRTVASEGRCRPCALYEDEVVSEDPWLRERCPLAVPSDDTNVGLIVGLVVAGMVLLSLPALWYSTRNYRRMRKLLNTNKVITEIAESVARMDFEAVAYLNEIEKPTKIQKAFICIVENLKGYKAYMPQSLFADQYSSDEEKTKLPNGSGGSQRSGTTTGASSSMRTSGSSNVVTRLDVMTKISSRTVSVVYCNFRGFHALAAGTTTSVTLEIHGRLIGAIASVARTYHGVPDTFQGDRVLITFNAVSNCLSQVQAASNAALQIAGIESKVKVQCGVDTGKAYCGNMGSEMTKRFTVLGGTVNAAALLCALNRHFETSVLVSSWTKAELPGNFDLKVMGWMRFPKRSELPTVIFSLLSVREVSGNDEWMYQLDMAERANNYIGFNEAALSLMKESTMAELTDRIVEEKYADFPELYEFAKKRQTLPPVATLDLMEAF